MRTYGVITAATFQACAPDSGLGQLPLRGWWAGSRVGRAGMSSQPAVPGAGLESGPACLAACMGTACSRCSTLDDLPGPQYRSCAGRGWAGVAAVWSTGRAPPKRSRSRRQRCRLAYSGQVVSCSTSADDLIGGSLAPRKPSLAGHARFSSGAARRRGSEWFHGFTLGGLTRWESGISLVADGVRAVGPRPRARLRAGGHLRLSTGPRSPGALTPPGEREGPPYRCPAPLSPQQGSAAHQEDGRCRSPTSCSRTMPP
jgi:hypothetical protein